MSRPFLSPLNQLLVEAGSLWRHGKQSPAARHCAAVEAARCPKVEERDVGRAKSLTAYGLKQLMQAAEHYRDREARDALMAGIANVASALKREPNVPASVPAKAGNPTDDVPYYVRDDLREQGYAFRETATCAG